LGQEFDRKMALISYDNAVEVSINSFEPIKKTVASELSNPKDFYNFPVKMKFFERYVSSTLHKPMQVSKEQIMRFHLLRNNLYHQGEQSKIYVPSLQDLKGSQQATLWVISTLSNMDLAPFLPTLSTLQTFHAEQIDYQATEYPPEVKFLDIFIDLDKKIREALFTLGIMSDIVESLGFYQAWDLLTYRAPVWAKELSNAVQGAVVFREKILDEEILKPREYRQMQDINKELDEAIQHLDGILRDYHKKILQASLSWTRLAMSNKVSGLGIIQQSSGTGISLSIIAYVTYLLKELQKSNWKILIVTDRLVIQDQLAETFSKQIKSASNRISTAKNVKDLQSSIDNNSKTVFITTAQKIRYLQTQDFINSNWIVILNEVGYKNFIQVKNILPKNSIDILFGAAFKEKNYSSGNFIFKYSFRQSVADGLVSPVIYLKRHLQNKNSAFDEKKPPSRSWENLLLLDSTQVSIVEYIIKDFIILKGKNRTGNTIRGLIVVPNKIIGQKLMEKLIVRSPDINISLFTAGKSDNKVREKFLRQGGLLITTSDLGGFDIPNLNICFILDKLSPPVFLQFFTRLTRNTNNDDRTERVLIDFVGHEKIYRQLQGLYE
jgi:hypothetical protein